jgi:hypothetical protein
MRNINVSILSLIGQRWHQQGGACQVTLSIGGPCQRQGRQRQGDTLLAIRTARHKVAFQSILSGGGPRMDESSMGRCGWMAVCLEWREEQPAGWPYWKTIPHKVTLQTHVLHWLESDTIVLSQNVTKYVADSAQPPAHVNSSWFFYKLYLQYYIYKCIYIHVCVCVYTLCIFYIICILCMV